MQILSLDDIELFIALAFFRNIFSRRCYVDISRSRKKIIDSKVEKFRDAVPCKRALCRQYEVLEHYESEDNKDIGDQSCG